MSKTTKIISIVVATIIILPVVVMLVLMSNFWSMGRSMSSGLSSYQTLGLSQQAAYDSAGYAPSVAMMPVNNKAVSDESFGGVGTSGSVVLPDTNRMIVKNGSVSVVVKDVLESVKNITSYTEGHKGFVVQSNNYKSGTIPYGVVTIRVPASEFEGTITYVKTLGNVVSENITGTDVTEEYVDLEGQLKNLQAAEQQFLAIMKRADKIADILAVQNELTRVRGQIEGIQGRMKYLKETADMSSITVNLSTDPSALPVVDKDTNTWKPVAVIKEALRSLVEVGKGVLNFLIWVVIFSPVWGGLIVLVRWVYRRMSRKNIKK
jgi:hypothetical protein